MLKFLSEQWLTIISIFLSGLISLIISAIYFHKGNRNNLQMAIVFPMISLLKESCTEDNFYKLNNMATSYLCKYLTKNEKIILTKLVLAYKEIAFYSYNAASTNAILSYFEEVLKKNDINPKPVPLKYQNVIVDYDYPDDIHYLEDAIEKELNEYDIGGDIEELETRVADLLSHFSKNYYSDKELFFFDDCRIYKVIRNSEEIRKRKEKTKLLRAYKNEFLNLKICKSISTGLPINDID